MKERPIWRPNAIPPEDWENLSRDDQVQWWKNNTTPAKTRPHPLSVVTLYQDGKITKSEIPICVFQWLSIDNVNEFVDGCPRELLRLIQSESNKLPAFHDDNGWSKVSMFHLVTYAPWVSTEEIAEANAQRMERYREGVRLFRESLPSA